MSAGRPEDHERVSIYHLDERERERLLTTANECVFNWCTRDEWPMGVIMSCVWHEGRMWLTATAQRHRVAAVRRNPKVSVVVTSTGTSLPRNKAVTIKGRCVVHEDRETKDWFYPALAAHIRPDDEAAARAFAQMLDSPMRVVLEVVPEKFITYDGEKMARHTAGKLDESELGPALSSDTERFEKERALRGLS